MLEDKHLADGHWKVGPAVDGVQCHPRQAQHMCCCLLYVREPAGKEDRIKRLSAIQHAAYDSVRAMDKYAGVDDATVSTVAYAVMLAGCSSQFLQTLLSVTPAQGAATCTQLRETCQSLQTLLDSVAKAPPDHMLTPRNPSQTALCHMLLCAPVPAAQQCLEEL